MLGDARGYSGMLGIGQAFHLSSPTEGKGRKGEMRARMKGKTE